jgi:hypothetical protein
VNYSEFINRKSQCGGMTGFDPVWMPDMLFDFQKDFVSWSIRKGKSAIFQDCGLGKTFEQIVWAENVARHTGGRVLILTPLAVSFQTVAEGVKIGVEVVHRREGIAKSDRIVVTNYERLHHFNSEDFEGVVCDESSILKNFDGATRNAVTSFMRKTPYRLLCTATAAPNDYIELGTSSEAIGDMGCTDMTSRFFKKSEKTNSKKDERRPGLYIFRGHAEESFWKWVCSWARACRKPSDLGYPDAGFALPELIKRTYCVKSNKLREGYLLDVPAVGLAEQRADLRRSIAERCEMSASLINSHARPAVAWCNLNDEGDFITELIPDAVQVSGGDKDERKEEVFADFAKGNIRVIVTKSTIAGFGLNWQHCAHMTFFPSHSYEQYYQTVRRMWRFGQKNPVTVDLITTEGQADVMANLERKSMAASRMFDQLVGMMWHELKIEKKNEYTQKIEVAKWLQKNK